MKKDGSAKTGSCNKDTGRQQAGAGMRLLIRNFKIENTQL